MWPALLTGVLLIGVVISLFCLKHGDKRKMWLRRSEAYFRPGALAEALIAICSGALLWIGFWDFMDSYLVPVTWWAKLCMLLVGALGAFATRSLYQEDPQMHPLGENTSAGVDGAVDDMELAWAADMSPRPRSLGASREDGAVALPSERKCFLNPPPFSCSRCTRALLATFAGLTMWVGLWDLLDAHLLPSLFDACLDEPNAVCGAVKLSLVAVGAFGLYLTRSLYGDSGSSGPVQFQRL